MIEFKDEFLLAISDKLNREKKNFDTTVATLITKCKSKINGETELHRRQTDILEGRLSGR